MLSKDEFIKNVLSFPIQTCLFYSKSCGLCYNHVCYGAPQPIDMQIHGWLKCPLTKDIYITSNEIEND